MSWSGWVGGLRSRGRRCPAGPVMVRSVAVVGCVSRPPDRSPVMTVARTVADVLADHVVFEVECIDRMYCNVYVPQLQHAGGLLGYIQRQLGLPIASTAPLGKITDAFAAAMRRFARDHGVTEGASRACTSTTSTPRSSSTTRKDARYGPRPPSTTRPTSGSGNG